MEKKPEEDRILKEILRDLKRDYSNMLGWALVLGGSLSTTAIDIIFVIVLLQGHMNLEFATETILINSLTLKYLFDFADARSIK